MIETLLDYYFYQQSYVSLKSKNMVKFCVHISPIFSYRVTYRYICMYFYRQKLQWHKCLLPAFIPEPKPDHVSGSSRLCFDLVNWVNSEYHNQQKFGVTKV